MSLCPECGETREPIISSCSGSHLGWVCLKCGGRPHCYGQREEDWDRCFKCTSLRHCSYETLTRRFPEVNVIG